MIKQLSQRLLGPVTLALLALTFWLGLWVTPPGPGPGKPRSFALRSPGGRVGGALRLLWHVGHRELPVPMEAHALGRHGPHCLLRDGDQRGLSRPHPHHGLDLGPPDLGRVVGVGRATHVDGDPVGLCAGLSRLASRQRRPRAASASAARSLRSSPRSMCRSTTSRSTGGTRCTKGRPSLPRTGTFSCTARCS